MSYIVYIKQIMLENYSFYASLGFYRLCQHSFGDFAQIALDHSEYLKLLTITDTYIWWELHDGLL